MAKTGSGAPHPTKLNKEDFISALRVKEEDFELPGGGYIRLRGLGLKKGMAAFTVDDEDPSARMKRIIMAGIVEPELAAEDLDALDEGQVGLGQKLVQKILALSGMAIADNDLLAAAERFLPTTPSGNLSADTPPKSLDDSLPSFPIV